MMIVTSKEKPELMINCYEEGDKLYIELVEPKKDKLGENFYTTEGVLPKVSIGIVSKYLQQKRWDVLGAAIQRFIEEAKEKKLL